MVNVLPSSSRIKVNLVSWILGWSAVAVVCLPGGAGQQDDICGVHNGRRLYLELGERSLLTAKNLSLSPAKYNHVQCSVEIVTCATCVMTVNFRHLALGAQPHTCAVAPLMEAAGPTGGCRCDYVWLSEPPYDEASATCFCGNLPAPGQTATPTYRSQTRTIMFTLFYSQHYKHAFTLQVTSEKNRQLIKGTLSQNRVLLTNTRNVSHGDAITSPFFPMPYPRDYGIEYLVTCESDSSVNCRIRIIFSDYQLADVSVMEFYDTNGQQMEICNGLQFRPPIIVSTGPSLLIRFYANGATATGYKASYSFITGDFEEKTVMPITDCGGLVVNVGGAITMMNMVERSKGETVKSYDCIWLIKPPGNFYRLKTHLYLKVDTFLDMAGNTELSIRQGQTSEGPLLETMRHPMAGKRARPYLPKEHVIPMDVGFYVTLKGFFNVASRLAIVYSAFTYMDCYSGSDFLCQNHRCIPAMLNCDGFDHCGDATDEPESCTREWEVEPVDRRWYSHTPNYYFPKMERYPDLKTATMVFLISSIGLIMLIASLVILLYRMGSRARQQRELQNHLQTISELLDGARIEEVVPPPDEPPDYEAPPTYDEIRKSANSNPPTRKRRHRTRSSPGPRAALRRNDSNHQRLNHGDHPEVQFRSLTPQATAINISRSCQVTPVPDSPPPPYSEAYSQLVVGHNEEIEAWVNMCGDETDLSVAMSLPSPSHLDNDNINSISCATCQVSASPLCSSSVSINKPLLDELTTFAYVNDVLNDDESEQVLQPLVPESAVGCTDSQSMQCSSSNRDNFTADSTSCTQNDIECFCKGACGCLSTPSNQLGYNLQALDIYFSSTLQPTIINKCNMSSCSVSVDNIRDDV